MPEIKGMLRLDQLSDLIVSGEIDTVLTVFTDCYGRLVGKRFDGSFFLDSVARDGTHACNYLLTVDMEMEPVDGYEFANWEQGYGDFHLQPDFSTLRVADWLDRSALVIGDVIDPDSHEPVAIAPRSMLARQIDAAAAMGYSVKAGSELEYYVFRDSYRDAAQRNFQQLEPAGWYIEDYHMLQGARGEDFNASVRRHLSNSGVPVESTKGEWGKGQHELNVQYADVLAMADRHAIYKQCLKEVADRQGRSVTFMAKFAEDSAGSSCHVHLSLRSAAQPEANAFVGDEQLDRVPCSNEFRWFLGGWIAHAAELAVCYAPTVNSYKRFQSGSWAPTKLAWSYDNRTAGFRVVGHDQSLRIECRIPGADCNPYLAYAAALASGLDGITKQIEPPEVFKGDVYQAAELPSVPSSLAEATDLFESSEFVRTVFGSSVVDHYTHFFRTEQAAWDKAVTDWERQRYFERI